MSLGSRVDLGARGSQNGIQELGSKRSVYCDCECAQLRTSRSFLRQRLRCAKECAKTVFGSRGRSEGGGREREIFFLTRVME